MTLNKICLRERQKELSKKRRGYVCILSSLQFYAQYFTKANTSCLTFSKGCPSFFQRFDLHCSKCEEVLLFHALSTRTSYFWRGSHASLHQQSRRRALLCLEARQTSCSRALMRLMAGKYVRIILQSGTEACQHSLLHWKTREPEGWSMVLILTTPGWP